MKRISVAMVTYQGEKYIKEQLDSILVCLDREDEIVISDDGSGDGTLEIIRKYAKEDKRIHLVDGPRKGVKANVENALRNCEGAYIFLADQDDIWMPEKVARVMAELKKITDADEIKAQAEADAKAKKEAAEKEAADKAAAEAAAAKAAEEKAKIEQMYKDISEQKELLERIAEALEKK